MTKKLAVLGSPIEHSLSPVIQLTALKSLGLEATFEKYEVSHLQSWLASHEGFDALSLTMPLKEQYLGIAKATDTFVDKALSANYLLMTQSGWVAHNTDVFGINQAIKHLQFKTVGVLGTGATARSALVALEGMEVKLWGRNQAALGDLTFKYSAISADIEKVLDCDLVISALPADILPELVSTPRPGVLLDAVYSRPSPAGFEGYVSGIEMLIWQAIGQLRLLVNGSFQPFENEQVLYQQMKSSLELAE